MAAAAKTWGVPVDGLAAQVAAARVAPALSPRQMERFVREYYQGRLLPDGFQFYDRDGRTPAVIWKKPGAIVVNEQARLREPLEVRRPPLEAVVPCLRRLTESGAQLWNDEILRLCAIEFAGATAYAEFASGRFFDYRFTTGLLGEEAASGACALRDAIMPDMDGFADRFTAGGLQALVAVARPAPYDDFAVFLQVRGHRLSDGHGLHGVIPMAYHQPLRGGEGVDVRGLTSALRELAEELCGLEESQAAEFERVPAIAELRRRAILEITGFTLNLVNGNYDYNILICHPDPAYWEQYARHWSPNWEADRTMVISSRDHGTFHRLMTQQDWVPQSLAALGEGLDRLRAIDPSRC